MHQVPLLLRGEGLELVCVCGDIASLSFSSGATNPIGTGSPSS